MNVKPGQVWEVAKSFMAFPTSSNYFVDLLKPNVTFESGDRFIIWDVSVPRHKGPWYTLVYYNSEIVIVSIIDIKEHCVLNE